MAGTMIQHQLEELRDRIEYLKRRREASRDKAEIASLDTFIVEAEAEIIETERDRVAEINRELERRAERTFRFLVLTAEKERILARHGELVLA